MSRFALSIVALVVCAAHAAHAQPAAKETREMFDAIYDVRETRNFALKWQPDLIDVDEAQAAALLAGFERSYAVLHDGLAYALPRCAEQARVNVYVSSAAGTPPIESYGGMMSIDGEGCAFLVLSIDMLTSGDPGTQLVVTHEYFHAVQFGTDAFSASPDAATGIDPRGWYFEATANWAVTQVYPDDDVVFGDLRSYLAGTEHSLFLTIFDVDDTSSVFAHEYGAFLFATFIESFHGGADVIRDSWRDAAPDDDPIAFLAERVGVAPGELLARFGAHNAVWSYPANVREKIDTWLPRFDVETVHARVRPDDDVVIIDDRPLHAFGYHVIELELDDDAGAGAALRIEADATGDRGTPSSLRVVAVNDDGAPEQIDTGVSGTDASVTVDGGARFVVVACDASTRDPFETFGYALTLSAIREDAGASAADGAGCSTAASDSTPCALLLALFIRRRRPR